MNLLKKILLFFSARKFIEIINSGFGWQSAEQDTQGHGPGDATHLQERIMDLEDEIMDLEDELMYLEDGMTYSDDENCDLEDEIMDLKDELDDFYDDFDDIDEYAPCAIFLPIPFPLSNNFCNLAAT